IPAVTVKPRPSHLTRFFLLGRVAAALLGSFGLLSLLISAIGLFGVMSYSVSRCTNEIGIRLALGAKPSNILRLIAGQGLKLTLIGLALGLAGAVTLTPPLAPPLFGRCAAVPSSVVLSPLRLFF